MEITGKREFLSVRSIEAFRRHRTWLTEKVTDDLRHRMDVFKRNGYIWPDGVNLFRVDSWLQVMIGQGLFPEHHHLAGGLLGAERLEQQLKVMREKVARDLATMPGHTEFVKQYCPADLYTGHQMQASAV